MIVLALRAVDSSGSGSSKNSPARNRLLRLKLGFRTLLLSAGSITIGRKSSCDLVLDDPQVSREHARVIVSDASAAIQDLSSGNGVQVNGRRIQGLQRLVVGDRIQIGVHTIEVIGPSDSGASVHDEAEVTMMGKVATPADWKDEGPTVVKNPRKP
ncbi:MAG: FHA domain-containing protein [Pseudomonadota bacterium]